MKSQCLERETIFNLVHRLLEPEEAAEARRHLFHCENCLRVARDFEKLDATLGEWREEQPSPWFDQRLKGALAASPPPSRLRFFFSGSPTRALATAMLALFVVAGSFMVYHFHGTTPDVQSNSPVVSGPPAPVQPVPAEGVTQPEPLSGEEELKMYQNLAVLDHFDLLQNFDVLSELPGGNGGK
jgi:hypothetical protein